ncbi:PREDICTED: uncharacterized protein LOC105967309 [Erythranthe guttata]|uniref:uncharacterized protein LOC105967309 n=1 Tax=Erythranthe guttata TaxID=4155 RepID=UPI00064DA880|nr:PREDICTED: uncharacterized protein LOC105967309 [Erythranthe guttata]|eukprot:XP_012847364.1 PREDICTED: uncharacterized protein LOC105967309 [Erythranthe guttata]
MREPEMQSTQGLIPWSFETNWVVARGSLEASVAVESSDYPIPELDPETPAPKSPLVLKPPVPDSAPCEIKISFQQKYDISQIYVRSTARLYEVYYAQSPNSKNEYLCTVRCGVAERDETLLQTNWIEEVAEKHGERAVGELTEEAVIDEPSPATSEDGWVKIKSPEVEQDTLPEQIYNSGMKHVQDLYEATAQISDADPCSLLTIRFLSLQDKGQVYVDEVYVFVDPAESSDSGNESILAASSTQSSLMAMFVPTLLQLARSGGTTRVQDKHASNEVLNGDNSKETGSKKIDEPEVRPETNQVPQKNVNPTELAQHTLAEKCVEPVKSNDLPLGNLETSMEQLISRVSRMEDFFVRFEEKMLKPIERIDARLQKVEDQLEKLAKNSQCFGSPHCTRFTAPQFSCSESNSSSFHNEQSDNPPCGASEPEKKDITSSNSTPEFSDDANLHPGLVVSAPEFSCGEEEDEVECDDLKPMNEPKKTLSINDALAAALTGLLSSAITNPSEPNQITSNSGARELNQYPEHSDSCQTEVQELAAAENDDKDLPRYAQVLTVKAPDFTTDENSDFTTEESESLFTSADSSHFEKNESTCGTNFAIGDLNESFEVNTIEGYFGGDNVDTSNDETNPEKIIDDEEIASGHVLAHRDDATEVLLEGSLSDSCGGSSSVVDFEFPILEVKFTSDVCTEGKCPLEALLDGVAESKTDDGSTEETKAFNTDGNEKTDLLVDVEVSSANEGSSDLDGGSQNLSTQSSQEMNVSLI